MTGKVLVADAGPAGTATVCRAINSGLTVQSCTDGGTAMRLIDSFQPDVLVLDLHLPVLDGISIIKALQDRPQRPALMITTYLSSYFVEGMLSGLVVDYVMLKPYDHEAMNDRILDLLELRGTGLSPEPPEPTCFTDVLISLSLVPGRRGFRYLSKALELYSSCPDISMTKELYPAVGRFFKASARSVERAIRTVIHDAWMVGDMDIWLRYFSPGSAGTVPRPTNRAFIAAISTHVLAPQEVSQLSC